MQNEYTEYVKKEEIIRLLKEHAKDGDNGTFISDATAKQIENFPPSEDVRENVYGEWRYYPILDRFGRRTGNHYAICSICGTPLPKTIDESEVCFCMKCGADMRGEKDDRA